MIKIVFFFHILLLGSTFLHGQKLNVMTFNIRYNNAGDGINAWPHRKDKVVSKILYHEVHLLGMQEALHLQMQDMEKGLKKFKPIGVGRDGGEKAEYSAIFYDTTRLELLQSNTLWLSQTPQVVASKGWDAALTRVMTWGKFLDRRTGKVFFAFNTHFDHVGQIARRESAKLVLLKVKEIAGNTPVLITGDFNAHPEDEPIKLITDSASPNHLTDSKAMSITPHYGPTGTFNGFQAKENANTPIDYIFLKGGWSVLSHATISQTWEGRFASDHFPVLAAVEIK